MAETKRLKIVMFPWLAFGHMIPFLELSKHFAQRGHHILYVSTTRNIKRLPKIPQTLASTIEFVDLELPRVEDLPPEAEATSDLPVEETQILKIAYDRLKEPMEALLVAQSPDWVVYDFSCYWLQPVAAKLGIKHSFFSIFMACTLAIAVGPSEYSSLPVKVPEELTVPRPWITFPTKILFKLHEAKKLMMQASFENASGVSDSFRLDSALGRSDAILVRSCWEIEDKYLHLLEQIHGKPVFPVGLLLPSKPQKPDDAGEDWRLIRDWLDGKEDRSVIYVAFGSETMPTQEELVALAGGLEISGLPFMWVLKKEVKTGNGNKAPLVLPDGFEERTKGRGLVWTSWAPQLRILSHRSIGGFLSHSGWSSVVEALHVGLPLILLPMFIDQGLVARNVSEVQAGYEVPRNEDNGAFTENAVAESLRLVVVDEGGAIYRQKAKEASTTLFGDEDLQRQYMDKVVEFFAK
ncbi:hypothetical protein Droror1_Dr00016972 [Drosera rotundifolia]